MVAEQIPKHIVKEYSKSVLSWASDMSEAWTNTLIGDMIDLEMKRLMKALTLCDFKLAGDIVESLAQMCEDAERKLIYE